jgi:hypothetical protein
LADRQGGPRSPFETLHEELDQGGLPDPRLTCQKDDLTPALVGFQEAIQQVLDLLPPTHHRLALACRGSLRSWVPSALET